MNREAAIIPPIDKKLLKAELRPERFLRYTNNGDNLVYLVNYHNSPNVVREIGRLRELTFRAAGGGTGLELDLDENDICDNCYDQLVTWNPEDEEIVAGYRLIKCKNSINSDGSLNLSTTHLFDFSDRFVKDFIPSTIELGRSFVQPKYQPALDNRKGIFSLDNLWDGLGAVVLMNPDVKYLFGKVTMYPHFSREGRDLLLMFMNYYFPDNDGLVKPKENLRLGYETDLPNNGNPFEGLEYKEGYKLLNGKIRTYGENIPPLINTYMNLSPTMMTFGTALNDEFGEVEETGILITLADIYETKKHRHMDTFERDRTFGSRGDV
ncbi:acetyltransferase (GNAT) family protein [Algoriphagus ratkowskyi]|uniref:Acetyltransferase (GNAT) family protein n=1 Tax=Algoriphagus ratkowskyi TaxID=57028 RepID=A0A2W7QZ35_9BACT|nr:GNAT family N-acetyltransferase [Algoriphagus ratkowskyi]PZX53803.1 acetyltransferase (GNAT) family protein [Algoriphagus ratkowskyi]TXD76791.1 GNAT family N-acetyltransferase [Algoriphagus ratkowskyi]